MSRAWQGRLRAGFAAAWLALTLGGCVSRSAGRAEADALIHERLAIDHGAPDDAATAKARGAILAQPLTAESAARLAVLQHPDVDAAFAEIGVARGELVSAVTLPNPEVEFAVRFHDGGPTYDLGATIDLTELLKLAARNAAAGSALDAASTEAVGAVMDVALTARRAFFDYVAARQVLELRRTSAFAVAQSADAARRIYEAGNSAALPVVQEQAMFEEARLMVRRAEVDELAARERLSAALGLFGVEAASWKAPERLLEPPATELALGDVERRALERSLDLAALRSRYAAAAGRSDVAAWGWLPHLSAGALAEKGDADWEIGPQVAVGIPIFDHGQGESAAAEAQLEAVRARLRGVATSLRASARTLAARLAAARDQVEFYRGTLLPLRRRVVEETQLQYNAMNTGVFQLIEARRAEIEAERAQVEALRDYWVAKAELEQLLAGRMVNPSSGTAMAAPMAVRPDGH